MTRRDRVFYRRMAIGFAIAFPLSLALAWMTPRSTVGDLAIGMIPGIIVVLWAHEVFD